MSVQSFHNATVFPLIEAQVTQLLKDELLKVSGITLVNDPKYADLVLSGSVVSAAEIPLALSSTQGIEQYLVEIVLSAKVTGYDGKIIWQGGSIIGGAPMYVNNNLAIFQQNQSYAMNEASQSAVTRLISSMAHNLKSATFIIPNQSLSQPLLPPNSWRDGQPLWQLTGTPPVGLPQ
ncbi:lipoprotein, partial [mine drainage metagenome]